MGSLRIRIPVAVNRALATAGAIPGTETSPIPDGGRELGTMITWTSGISSIHSQGLP
jgi:hypothetical protein